MRRIWMPAVMLVSLFSLACATTPSVSLHRVRSLDFEVNRGQADSQALFLAHGNRSTIFLTHAGVVISPGKGTKPIKMTFADAHPRDIAQEGELAGKVNYLIGRDVSKWRTNVPTFARVRYRNLYPGIDALFYGKEGRLEYDLVVTPNGSVKRISLGFEGVRSMRIASHGDLVLELPNGELRQQRPQIYQMIDEARRPVAGHFVIHRDGTVGFAVATYDHRHALIIDPTLVYSTLLAGLPLTFVGGVAVDGSGHVFVTGSTYYSFPTKSPFEGNQNSQDAFVTKFTANGGGLVYSTYLGGNGVRDAGAAIGTDRFGNAYLVGTTDSTDFPVTASAIQPTLHGGPTDAFATKLNPAGSGLVYSTYLGGSSRDGAFALAIDSQQRLYIAGQTCSSDFPVANAYQSASGTGACAKPEPGPNGFLARINSTGTALDYSTYLGGSTGDWITGAAVDSTFQAYVTGSAASPDFPTTAGAFQTTLKGSSAAFVTKFSADGKSLVYSTLLGGSLSDAGYAIALDSTTHAYITGYATSTDFPVTASAYQKVNHGQEDAFVTKMSADGSSLVYSTYIGGSGQDFGYSVAVDGSGQAHIAGSTSSTNFPVQNAIQASYGGNFSDAFITKFSASGNSRIYSTYFGGTGQDSAHSIRLDGSGNAYVGGSTTSTNFRTTTGAFQRTFRGNSDGWIAKIKP